MDDEQASRLQQVTGVDEAALEQIAGLSDLELETMSNVTGASLDTGMTSLGAGASGISGFTHPGGPPGFASFPTYTGAGATSDSPPRDDYSGAGWAESAFGRDNMLSAVPYAQYQHKDLSRQHAQNQQAAANQARAEVAHQLAQDFKQLEEREFGRNAGEEGDE